MKLSILIESGSFAGQQRELTDGVLTIGREATNTLQFDLSERLISKQHASIQREADGFYLYDAGSTNGTFVNEQRVSRVRLNPGDTIHFGGRDGVRATVNIEAAQTAPQPSQQNYATPQPQPPQTPPVFNQTPQQVQPHYAANYTAPAASQRQSETSEGFGGYRSTLKESVRESFANRVFVAPAPKPAAQQQTAKYVGLAVALVAAVFLALIITAFTVLELGIVLAVIAAVVAFVPAFFYVLPLLWLDRYDPEPPLNLAIAFGWGALVSVFVSLIINTLVGAVLGPVAAAVVSAPIIEEACKGLGVLMFLIFWRREFDGIVDGLVYAGVIALGFATVENVLYYGRAMEVAGLAGLGLTLFLRGILSPFAHVIFTAMTGIGCGVARETHNTALRFIAPLIGYFAAVFLHAMWNGIATFGGLGGFLIAYLILGVPFFLLFIGFSVYVMRRENKILKQTLAVEVAKGLITNEQMETATSATRSLGWMFGGIAKGKLIPRYKFLRATARLGLAWWHIQRAQAAKGETRSLGSLHEFEADVKRWQPQI